MVHVINKETCISCGSCVSACPQDAIIEESDAFFITDSCIDCGACVDACPVEAISAG